MRTRLWVGVLALGVLFAARSASGSHVTFNFHIDRFTIDGNTFGAADGTPDFVDDFDGDSLTYWNRFLGTASVSGGFLSLHDPGTTYAYGPFPGTLDMSDVISIPRVTDGGGNMVATSVWAPDPLLPNDFIHFSMLSAAGSNDEVIGIGASNFAEPFSPVGYVVTQHSTQYRPETGWTLQAWNQAIDPAAITGNMVFAIAFDDTRNLVTTSYSLDGGETFQSPFPPVPMFTLGGTTAQFVLGADPQDPDAAGLQDPCPTGQGSVSANHVDAVPGNDTLTIRGLLGPARAGIGSINPATDGFQLKARGFNSPNTPFFTLADSSAIPPGAGTGCNPQDGWKIYGSNRFTYKNISNALPPLCTPGSALGVTQIKVKDLGSKGVNFQVKAKKASLVMVAPLSIDLAFGSSAAKMSNGQCMRLGLNCKINGARLSCR